MTSLATNVSRMVEVRENSGSMMVISGLLMACCSPGAGKVDTVLTSSRPAKARLVENMVEARDDED